MRTDLSFGRVTIPVTEQVRISTLNLLHNPEHLDERIDFFCSNLLHSAPDVLCLQEVIFDSGDTSVYLKRIAAETGLEVVSSLVQHENRKGLMTGTAILSSLEIISSGSFFLDNADPGATIQNASYAVLKHPLGSAVIAITAHLQWGGDKEYGRLTQLMAINSKAGELYETYRDLNPVILLTGDFNALPDGDAVRFMTGKGVVPGHQGAFWTDAWATLGNADNEFTMVPDNHWARETAFTCGITVPELMPKRRIDYIMSYGWTYGKHGSLLTFSKDYDAVSPLGYPISDHAGLTADYWMQPYIVN